MLIVYFFLVFLFDKYFLFIFASIKVIKSKVIMNMGDSLAKISSVEESCSCIHVEKFTRKIPPKQKGTIKGVVDIKKQKGHFSKPIFVNCSGDKVLLLRIIGDIS